MPQKKSDCTPILLLQGKDRQNWLGKQPTAIAEWAKASRFDANEGGVLLIPGKNGAPERIVVAIKQSPDIWTLAALPTTLPPCVYHLETKVDQKTADALLLGWLLGSYRFNRYRKQTDPLAELLPPEGSDEPFVRTMAEALCQARDLINTPANDMGPAELAAAYREAAKAHRAEYYEIVGEDLLTENYPAIHTVGRASSRAPRLIDLRWGDKGHPKVTLVGKGVCFDSGGLDIKPSSGMKLMKKDMGGAAIVLAVGRMIMAKKLPVRLRILAPAVENSISANAYRPSDIIKTRKGLSVEVGNTDAEGRLILGDALAEADSERPELLIDCATLTGAARTALGTDLPALFTTDDTLAADFARHAASVSDPLWRLPLWPGYREMLNSPIADINSAPDGPYAGAITAALYLKEFVTQTGAWAHIDLMAWNLAKRPGRPQGGEAMAARAIFALISERFTAK